MCLEVIVLQLTCCLIIDLMLLCSRFYAILNKCLYLIPITSRTYMYNTTQPAKEKKNPYIQITRPLPLWSRVRSLREDRPATRHEGSGQRDLRVRLHGRLWGISTDKRRHTPCPGHVGGARGRLLGVLASGGLTALGGREENNWLQWVRACVWGEGLAYI